MPEPEAKTFFLSHSSKQKPFVESVAEQLGQDLCWLDAWDLHAGDELLEFIDQGIAQARIFAIFWSAEAAASPWVAEELGQARYRKLRRNDVKIVPVRLDSTPMPLWLERLLYVKADKGPERVASELLAAATGKPLLRADAGVPDPAFQNRSAEADALEAAYASEEFSGVIVAGLPGMGKSALIKWALTHRLPHLRLVWLDLERSNTPTLFYASLADRLGLRLPQRFLKSGDWATYWKEWASAALDSRTDALVLDGLNAVLDPDGNVPAWLLLPLQEAASSTGANQLPLVISSGRAPQLPAKTTARLTTINLSRLRDSDVIRSLRVRLTLTHPRRIATEPQLESAARIVNGYPLATQLWAAHASRVGVDLAVLDPSPVTDQVQEAVADMLSSIKRTEREDEILLMLALLRFPIGADDAVNRLGVKATDLSKLQQSLLLDPSSSGLALHGLVAKHLIEKFSTHSAVRSAHERIGRFFLSEWRAAPDDLGPSAALGSQAYYHLLAAGRTDEAAQVGWSLAEEARAAIGDLYRLKQTDTVIAVGTQLAANLGDQVPTDVLFYLGLASGRRGSSGDSEVARSSFSRLLDRAPDNRFYWSGFGDTLQRLGQYEEARDAYVKARALGKSSDPIPSLRLGELFLRLDKIDEAEPFLKEAYSRAKSDLQVVAGYASLLEHRGRFDEALALVRQDLQRRPDDIGLNHRAGQILREMGKKTEALPYLSKAAKGAASPASYTSLADLYLDMGRIKEAEEVMERHPGPREATYFNVMGNIARRQERFLDAEKFYAKCSKAGGAGVVLQGSLAHLRIDQARKALDGAAVEAARAYLAQADEEIRRGLTLDPANQILLWHRKDCEQLKIKVAQRAQS